MTTPVFVLHGNIHDVFPVPEGENTGYAQLKTFLARRLFARPQDLEGAAQSWLEHGERTPRAARLASSVVLLRDSPTGLETWLAYRPGSSPLGVLAFPGGSLDAADDATLLVAGVALFGRKPWAGYLAIGLCILSAIANFFFIPYYPFWSLVVIALNATAYAVKETAQRRYG